MPHKDNNKRRRSKHRAAKLGFSIDLFNALNIISFYTMFLTKPMIEAFQATGKFILFPSFAVTGLISAMIAWRKAHLSRYKKRPVFDALFETTLAIAATIILIGGIAGSALLAAITPIGIAALLSIRFLQALGSSIFYGTRSFFHPTEKKKHQDREKALHYGIQSVTFLFSITATMLVFVFAKYALAPIAITGAIINFLHTSYRLGKLFYDEYKTKQSAEKTKVHDITPKKMSTFSLLKFFGFKKENNEKIEMKEIIAPQKNLPQINRKTPLRSSNSQSHSVANTI